MTFALNSLLFFSIARWLNPGVAAARGVRFRFAGVLGFPLVSHKAVDHLSDLSGVELSFASWLQQQPTWE